MIQTVTAVRLGDIAEINYGYTAKASFEGDGPKFLRITDIQNGGVAWDTVPVCPINQTDLNKHRLQEDDIVFARTGATTGKSYRLENPPEAVAASYLIRLRIHDEEIHPAFVSLFFQTKEYWDSIAVGTSGSAQGGFNASKLADLCIPKPPLPEQKRIVAILDEAFAGIDAAVANTEKNLANARELFESYLNAVFTQKGDGWVEKTLGDICETTQGVQIPKSQQMASSAPGYKRYLYISDFDHDKNLKYVEDVYPKKIVTNHDLIVVNTGTSAGKIHRGIDGILSNNLFKVSFDIEEIDDEFLYFFVTSPPFKEHQIKIVRGTANPHMGHENFKSTPFSHPCLAAQKKISAKIQDLCAEVQRLEAIYRQKLEALAELKQAILQKAFAGKLTAKAVA